MNNIFNNINGAIRSCGIGRSLLSFGASNSFSSCPYSRCHLLTRAIRPSRGVSLMETVVVVGVMTILLLIISQIFILNYDIYDKQSGRTGNETGAILAAKTISQMARGSANIEASHAFGGTTRTSSDSVLVLKLPSLDTSGNIIADTFDYVAFYRHATQTTKIMADIDADANSIRQTSSRLITAYNSTLIFRYNNQAITAADRVSVFVVNTQTKRGTTLTTRGWTSIFLRNSQ